MRSPESMRRAQPGTSKSLWWANGETTLRSALGWNSKVSWSTDQRSGNAIAHQRPGAGGVLSFGVFRSLVAAALPGQPLRSRKAPETLAAGTLAGLANSAKASKPTRRSVAHQLIHLLSQRQTSISGTNPRHKPQHGLDPSTWLHRHWRNGRARA